MLAQSPSLELTYRSYWSGTPAAMAPNFDPDAADAPEVWSAASQSLPARLLERNIPSTLISDSEQVADWGADCGFTRQVCLPAEARDRLPKDVAETSFGRLTAALIESLPATAQASLTWLHASALDAAWDAPLTLRRAYREDDDPEPADCIEPPSFRFDEEYDPDEILSLMHAYAGQVSTVDTCLDALLAALDQLSESEQPWLVVSASRGFPLGERGSVGAAGDGLYGEVLQVPLFIRPPGGGAAQRISRIADSLSVYQTLLSYFGLAKGTENGWGRDLNLDRIEGAEAGRDYSWASMPHDEWAIRTPIWFLRAGSRAELYVKPDDRWEVNEVADRCPDIVERLHQSIAEIRDALQSERPANLPTLATDLAAEVD